MSPIKLEDLITEATEATEADAPPLVLLRAELRKRGGVYSKLAALINPVLIKRQPEFGKARAPQPAPPPTQTRMLAWEDLPSKGIYLHRNYLRRLWEEGRFPKPIHLSARKLAWPEDVIDERIGTKSSWRTIRSPHDQSQSGSMTPRGKRPSRRAAQRRSSAPMGSFPAPVITIWPSRTLKVSCWRIRLRRSRRTTRGRRLPSS